MSRDAGNRQELQVHSRMKASGRICLAASCLAFCGLVVLFSHHTLSDLDIWFHWRAGQDILAGEFPRTNHYSFSEPDRPWTNHEWLFQVLVAGIGRAGQGQDPAPSPEKVAEAWNALRTFLALILALVILRPVVFPALSGRGSPGSRAWLVAVMLAGLGTLWTRLTLRPELVSSILLVLVLDDLEDYLGRGNGSRPWWDPRGAGTRIPLWTCLWAQFHGFAALAPVLVLAAGILNPLQRRIDGGSRPGRGRGLVLVGGATLVALLLTPGGIQGFLYPLQAAGQFGSDRVDLRDTISELVPLFSSPNSLHATLGWYLAALGGGLVWLLATWPRVPLLRAVLFCLAAWAALMTQRSLGMFGLAFMILWRSGLPEGSRLLGRLRASPLSVRGTPVAAAGAAVCLGAAVLASVPLMTDGFYLGEGVARRFGSGLTPAQQPVAAMEVLAGRPSDRLFANIDAAGFVLGNTDSRVFVDGRTEAYSDRTWSRYLAVKQAGPSGLRELAAAGPGAVCLALAGGAFKPLARDLLADGSWRLVAADAGGILWYEGGEPGHQDEPGMLRAAGRKALTDAGAEPGSARRADLAVAAAGLFQLAGDDGGRLEALRRAVAARGDHPLALHNLGNALMERREFRQAGPLFEAAVAANPRLAGSALNAGVCRLQLEEHERAAEWFERALDIDGESFQAWANLAAARLALQDEDGAVAALEKALAIRPGEERLRSRLEQLRRR